MNEDQAAVAGQDLEVLATAMDHRRIKVQPPPMKVLKGFLKRDRGGVRRPAFIGTD